jgi:peptidoglycan DL-endopeptidase CwlO
VQRYPRYPPARLIGRTGRWTVSAAAALVMAAGVLAVPAASAQPKPSKQELTTQPEKLTERYNGLRVQLTQAQRAATAAQTGATRQQQNFTTMRAKIAQLAAESYKHGGLDPAVGLATAQDPQTLLDQSATLDYISAKGGEQVRVLLQNLQETVRSRKAAQDRVAQVQ